MKAIGRTAEARFLADCVSRGFTVAFPFGDAKDIDCVVVSGRRCFRVQVKSCARKRQRKTSHAPCYDVELRGGGNSRGSVAKRNYELGAYDIVAIWLAEDGLWAFREAHETRMAQGIRINPKVAVTNNWEIFDAK